MAVNPKSRLEYTFWPRTWIRFGFKKIFSFGIVWCSGLFLTKILQVFSVLINFCASFV